LGVAIVVAMMLSIMPMGYFRCLAKAALEALAVRVIRTYRGSILECGATAAVAGKRAHIFHQSFNRRCPNPSDGAMRGRTREY